ncbi:MAG TPA: hypothetical protein VGX51_13125, partial [Solirubrobacteraceae bacterium]|nr:hypothetical protein [Solirubrobacteraceae bacterium]
MKPFLEVTACREEVAFKFKEITTSGEVSTVPFTGYTACSEEFEQEGQALIENAEGKAIAEGSKYGPAKLKEGV